MASASIGDPQSLNLFAYVTNNLVDFVDLSGLYVDASSCVLVCAQSFDKDGNPTGSKDCEYKCEESKIVESEETGPVTGGNDPIPPDGGGGSCKIAKLLRIWGPKFKIQKARVSKKMSKAQKRAAKESENRKGFFAPAFATKLIAAFSELNRLGIVPQINSGYRNNTDQTRMRNGGSGKNPAAKNISMHQTGYAVDINGTSHPSFKIIRKVMKKFGFSWGGNFRSPDKPHFYLNPFGSKGTKKYRKKLKAAAIAADNYYRNRNMTCIAKGA